MLKISATCVFLILAGSAVGQTRPFSFKSQIGVVTMNSSGDICLTIPLANLNEGDPVQLVVPDKPQRLVTATVQRRLSDSCTESSDFSENVSSYSVRRISGRFESGTVGFAVVGAGSKFRVANGFAHADLNRDGNREYFRACASLEGLHLTIWSGRPLKGVRRWHHYYYLGYDLEANCTNSEVR